MITSIRPLHLSLVAGLGLVAGLAGCASTSATAPATAAQPMPTMAQAADTARDDAIAMQVRSALAASPGLAAAQPVIVVYQRGVFLTGIVRLASDKDQATRLARTVSGVNDVTNNLTVQSVADESTEAAEDIRITRQVKETFAADPAINALGAFVATFKRVVYLSGTVASPDDRARADRLARTVPGVVDVTNNIGPKA
jgi:osmotically-inducible protein OsmY